MEKITLRFTGYRKRLLDPDNYAAGTKDLIDGLRHAGLIPDDNPEIIKLETSQEKIKNKDQERTEIEIHYPYEYKK